MPKFLDNPSWYDKNGDLVNGYDGPSDNNKSIAVWDNTNQTIIFANLFPVNSIVFTYTAETTPGLPGTWQRAQDCDTGHAIAWKRTA